MTKREYCKRDSIAYYSGIGGVEIKGIEYGINDYVYCVSNAWYGGESAKRYHRVKVNYDRNGHDYIRLHGYRIPLSECIRM